MRLSRAALTLCLLSLLLFSETRGVEPLLGGRCCEPFPATGEEEEEEDEEDVCYGPCDGEPPKTLLQWSRCASFGGGPPGRDEPLASDRPDFTEASTTVGRGVVQLEVGFTYSFDDDGVTRTANHSFPEALFRIGAFAEWLEFRIAYNHGSEATASAGGPFATTSGAEDLYLGVKLGLTPQDGILPEMALLPQMTVPSGHSAFTGGDVLPGVNWLYGWDINNFLSTAGSTQFNRAIDDGTHRPYVEFAQSWTIGYSLTERLGGYTEWFALVPDGADTARTEHYFDGGFTFSWSNDLQFDIRAGVGLNEAAVDYFLGTGFVKRF